MLDLIEKYNELSSTEDMTLQEAAEDALDYIESIINGVFMEDQENEQWFLNFLDSLNKMSTTW